VEGFRSCGSNSGYWGKEAGGNRDSGVDIHPAKQDQVRGARISG
jgi:hypothetical protein